MYTDSIMDYKHTCPWLPQLPDHSDIPGWERYQFEVMKLRYRVNRDNVSKETMIQEIARCKHPEWGVQYFINIYGSILEVRQNLYQETEHTAVATSGMIPFILYPYQMGTIDWYLVRMRSRGNRGDGLIKKSRDMGLSNLFCAIFSVCWLTWPTFHGRMMSRNENLVDDSGNPDSLFWKIDGNLKSIPNWLMVAFAGTEFQWKKHRTDLTLVNPQSGNTLIGESTSISAGRGGRGTAFFMDEFAEMENGASVWSNTRANSPHRFAAGTVHTHKGMHMYDLDHGKNGFISPPTLEMRYDFHPYHTEQWLEDERERDTEEGIQREILMNYFADAGEFVYPELRGIESTDKVGNWPMIPYAGPLFTAIDDGWKDKFVVHWLQYETNTGLIRLLDSYAKSGKVTAYHGSILTGIPIGGQEYTKEDLDLMEWVRSLPPVFHTGDTHGFNTEQITGKAPFDYLRDEFGIFIYTSYDSRLPKDRRTILKQYLPMVRWHAIDGVMKTLECFQGYKFIPQKPGQIVQREARTPAHDQNSDHVTSLEHWAVNFHEMRDVLSGQNIIWEGPRGIG